MPWIRERIAFVAASLAEVATVLSRSDLILALRTLARRRAFAASIVLPLGIAIAVASVISIVADQVLGRPLPYHESDRLLLLWEKSRGGAYRLASYPTFLDWRGSLKTIEDLAYARGRTDILATSDGPARATTAFVSPRYFSTLGARALAGRFFAGDEEAAGRGDAVVLSERFWRSQFGGDPNAAGRSVTLSGRAVTIVGVVSTPMSYPLWADMWRPISAIVGTDAALSSRHHHTDSRVIARLRPGVAPAAAMAELGTLEQGLAEQYADHGVDWTSTDFKPFTWEFVGDSATALKTLVAGAGLTLLIACINVATLLLLRTLGRDRELAIRSALGAARPRLVLLCLLECAWLAVAAVTVAGTVTAVALTALRVTSPSFLPRSSELSFGIRSVAIVFGLTLIVMALAALPAIVRMMRGGSAETLRATGHASATGRASVRWRRALVTAQLALALTLISGAGLLLQSFAEIQKVDLGFDATNLMAFSVAPPVPKYETPAQAAALYTRLSETVSGIPGVEGVAISNHTPLGGGWVVSNFVVPGRATEPNGGDAAIYKTVSASYLGVMKARLLRGRWFDETDMRTQGNGVVINDQLAQQVWPNADPVGKAITIYRSSQARPGFGDAMPSTVIGVVAGTRHLSVTDEPANEVYVPYTREVWPGVALLIRTRSDPRAMEPAVRRAVLALEPELPVAGSTAWHAFEPIGENIARMVAPRRTVMTLVLSFGLAALALAALGVYGVTAFGVALRRREFGVRLAIGATSRSLTGMVLRQGAGLAAVGVLVGVVAGFAATRALRASIDSALFRTSPVAVVPTLSAAIILVVVAVAATWLPARRAARTDPLLVLRAEE